MASPLRSWSPLRPGRAAGERRRGTGGAAVRGVVEPLENRQLLAAALVSFDSAGFSSGNDDSTDPDVSSTGRFVAFVSTATDLVAEDTNATADVYLRDLQTGTTRLVSFNSAGNGTGSAASLDPSVSDDGRFVVFTSTANNLVAGDNNNASDVFVRDMFTNSTRLVSVNIGGTIPGNGASQQGVISDNGRFVAFSSDASNITSNDLTTTRDVFLRDLIDNDTTLISVSRITGLGGNGASQDPGINSTGQFVAFVTAATDLTSTGPTPGPGNNVYVFDTDVNVDLPVDPDDFPETPVTTTTLVSTTGVAGTGGGADIGLGAPTVSDTGQYVAFSSASTSLVSGDINGVSDVFRKDRNGGAVALVSQNTAGVFANGASQRPKISADGRYVAFSSVSTNLVAADVNSGVDVYLRDVDANQTVLVSSNLAGTAGTNSSSAPSITDDARLVAFQSDATTLVTDPVEDTNVFVATTPLTGNDTERPTFRVPPQPDLADNAVGANTLAFYVIYDDNVFVDAGTFDDLDLTVTGPNGFNEGATLFTVISTDNLTATVRYDVPAPGGDLSSADNGTYTITVVGGQVADFSGNFVTTGSAGTFTLDVPPSETVLPLPTFFGGSPAVGSQTYDFTVVFSERGGIDFATFGNDDIQVNGPNGFSQNATFVSQTPLNATQTSVIYRITAPGGVWDAVDTGPYTVSVISGGVLDVATNSVQSGTFGTFTALGADLVAIPLRNLRSGAISGVDQQRAKVRILNQGTFATTVPVAVTLYTSLNETLDAGDATIGTFIESRPIKADDFRELKVRFTYPQVPAGNYFVIAQVDSANAVVEQSETNNVIASFDPVGLSAPFVDLVPTLVPFSGNRSRLGTNDAIIRIRNAGNVAVDAEIVVGLTAISDVTPEPQERPVANIPITVKLKPGQSRTFRLPFTYPLEFERGTYRLVATVDSTNVVPERDDVNNRVVSLSAFNFA